VNALERPEGRRQQAALSKADHLELEGAAFVGTDTQGVAYRSAKARDFDDQSDDFHHHAARIVDGCSSTAFEQAFQHRSGLRWTGIGCQCRE
jgi:hypothetical protein